jgi:predicted N-formylglutamate amidohydrolase
LMAQRTLIVSCEHGGNSIPAAYAHLFKSSGARKALATHRGYDIGALALARGLARQLGAPLRAATVSRLLIDLNRSPHHHHLLSEFSGSLKADERDQLKLRYHRPHRDNLQRLIAGSTRPVLHVAVHSFTPRLNGEVRRADVGLLYDSRRRSERTLCADWRALLRLLAPDLVVRRNYPYLGKADGLMTHYRRCFSPRHYLGVELEANQARLLPGSGTAVETLAVLGRSLKRLLSTRH